MGSGACRGLRADGAKTGPAAKDASRRADPTVTLLPSPRTAPHGRHAHAPHALLFTVHTVSSELPREWVGLFLVAANEESISSPATSRACPPCWSHRIEHEKKLVLQECPGVPTDGPWASTGGMGALPRGVRGKQGASRGESWPDQGPICP